jgi:hypothetical protein
MARAMGRKQAVIEMDPAPGHVLAGFCHVLTRTSARPLARAAVVVLLACTLLVGSGPPPAAQAVTTWSRNLWVSSAFLYQDPYRYDCVGTSAMVMLNLIAARGTGGNGFGWSVYRVKENADPADLRDMTSIQAFARKYDTLDSAGLGSDAHGWRNALNAYGWGAASMKDPALRVYEDKRYTSFASAVKAAVKAIARRSMPVGILARAGTHAQIMTGYVVSGADPRTSDSFTVLAVYLADPLRSAEIVNRKISYTSFRDGALIYRFRAYRETDSPKDDPYTAGWIRSSVSPSVAASEWYGKWVVILPIRSGLP